MNNAMILDVRCYMTLDGFHIAYLEKSVDAAPWGDFSSVH